MRIVPRNQDVAGFPLEPIGHPPGRILRLQIARRRKFRQRVAGAPEPLGCLTRTKLSTVPDDGRVGAAKGGIRGQTFDSRPPDERKRPERIDFPADRLTVMSEVQQQNRSLGVRLLADGDADLEPILGQRNRTRRKRIEGAWRVVGLVEIQHRGPVVAKI